MARAGFWSLCAVVLLAALALVVAEDAGKAEKQVKNKTKSAVKKDAYGNKILAEYPLNSGGNMRVMELPHGARAIAFGEHDFQTLSSQHSVANDAQFDDIDYYIKGYLMAMGWSPSFHESLKTCSAPSDNIQPVPVTHHGLMFGLGGGSMARYFHGHFPFLDMTVVEIEPGVIQAAKDFFSVKEDKNLHIEVADIRDYLAKLPKDKKFDFIFHDGCDGNGYIPILHTKEFLTSLKERLLPGGIMSVNMVFLDPKLESETPRILEELLTLYREVFPHVTTLCLYGGHTMIFTSIDVPFSEKELMTNVAARMNDIEPTSDHAAFLEASWVDPASSDYYKRCSSQQSANADMVSFTVRNTYPKVVDLYWDQEPKRFHNDCSKYPAFKKNSRSMPRRQMALGQNREMTFQTYPGHVFLAVVNKTVVIDCTTIGKKKSFKWKIGESLAQKP